MHVLVGSTLPSLVDTMSSLYHVATVKEVCRKLQAIANKYIHGFAGIVRTQAER